MVKMNKMKPLVIVLAFMTIFFVGCFSDKCMNYEPIEREHLYWKDIKVKVIDIDYDYWLAKYPRYSANITVYSEEYQLSKTLHLKGADARKAKDVCEGDILTAELYTWKIDSTNTIIRREINKLIIK